MSSYTWEMYHLEGGKGIGAIIKCMKCGHKVVLKRNYRNKGEMSLVFDNTDNLPRVHLCPNCETVIEHNDETEAVV